MIMVVIVLVLVLVLVLVGVHGSVVVTMESTHTSNTFHETSSEVTRNSLPLQHLDVGAVALRAPDRPGRCDLRLPAARPAPHFGGDALELQFGVRHVF